MESENKGLKVVRNRPAALLTQPSGSDYESFIRDKIAFAKPMGIEIDPSEVHPLLKPHQRDTVVWACRGGRRGIFLRFGLGKSLIQLSICDLMTKHIGPDARALIVCPLGVRQEFAHDAKMIGLRTQFIQQLRDKDDCEAQKEFLDLGRPVYVTNYESVRSGKLDPRGFDVVSLDEAAILRGFGSTLTFRKLMGMFEGTSTYRFVATATPDPNEYIELAAYADWLGVMETGEIKTRWFKRDSTKADKLTLHKHKEEEFWHWVSTWALFMQAPSDLGYDDTGYDLPPLTVRWHEIPTDHKRAIPDRNGQKKMFNDASMGLSEAAAEKRNSMDDRIAKMKEIVAESPDDHMMIWCDLEKERDKIDKALPGCVSVYGTQKWELREKAILNFAAGSLKYLSSKASMLGAGVNLQRFCHRVCYVGIGFKFNDFIQSIHRVYRFLQTHPVTVDLIYTEAEHGIRQVLEDKWKRYDVQCRKMSEIIRQYGLATNAIAATQRAVDVERREVSTKKYRCICNDSVRETATMADNSVGLIVTSIPFAFQYEYTPSFFDFGHTDSNDHFWQQMNFLSPHLFRVLQPGRVFCCHVKDRIVPGGLLGLGFQTLHPFHAEAIFHYQRHGFAFLGMKTVVTDVVRENNQTYRLGWSEQCKDGSRMGCGVPEYVLLFRKPPTDRSDGYADVPVLKHKPNTRTPSGEIIDYDYDAGEIVPGTGYSRARWQFDAHGFQRTCGNRFLTPQEVSELPHRSIFRRWRDESLITVYDFERHLEIGEQMEKEKRLPSTFMLLPPHSWHPDVWTDVARMRTLNMIQQRKGQQQHLCPMQFDIVNRLIVQLSNEGDVVFDPFGGLMTVPYCSIKLGRFGLGCELNPGYWSDGVRYCEAASAEANVPTLFGMLAEEEESESSEGGEESDGGEEIATEDCMEQPQPVADAEPTAFDWGTE